MTRDLPHVHVLGGGVGGITAAYQLSTGNWKERFSGITVHQLGWRLGGKGASGRDADHGQRIQEHGLHVWFGAYENAFRMLDECHRELDRWSDQGIERWPSFNTSVQTSFAPADCVGLMEDARRVWRPWVARFPRHPGQPWDRDLRTEPAAWPPSIIVLDYLDQLVALGRSVLGSLEGGFRIERARRKAQLGVLDAFDRLLGLVARALRGQRAGMGNRRLTAAEARRWIDRNGAGVAAVLATADTLIDAVGLQVGRVVRDNEEVRRLWAIVDLVLAVARGLLRDRVVDDRALDALDMVEFREWLVSNGATVDSVEGPFVRAVVYDLAFAYVDGRGDRPSCGAGTAIRGLHRLLFTYRGALMWKLEGGMGDVVFAPLYELLVKREVEFAFFHQITDLHVEGRRVTMVEYRQQVDAPPDDPRLMLVDVEADGRVGACWPAAPMVHTDVAPQELESTWWRHGDAQHIDTTDDIVVLAISVAALRYVASQLIDRSPAWQAMVDGLKTVATQALQLWVGPTTEALGWERNAIVGGYGKPFDTWSDMPQARRVEPIGPEIGALAYFCSVIDLSNIDLDVLTVDPSDDILMQHHGDVTAAATKRMEEDVDIFIRRRIPLLWPGTTVGTSIGPDDRRPHLDIEVGRYERVNVDPTERYVLSVPGTSRLRLRPDRSGFENLYLAGDWTECTINAGCVEAAVISGMTAARAILGQPLRIIGERQEG
jgi:uncharacterized protein with NAD-binding domain and iron-sulfur cluster